MIHDMIPNIPQRCWQCLTCDHEIPFDDKVHATHEVNDFCTNMFRRCVHRKDGDCLVSAQYRWGECNA